MQAQRFDRIPLEIPWRAIYYRLGYAEGKTVLNRQRDRQVKQTIVQAAASVELKGAGARFRLKNKTAESVCLEDGTFVRSTGVAALLRDAEEALLLAATAGVEVVKLMRHLQATDRLQEAVIYDAVASEMVDGALDWLMQYVQRSLLRENLCLTKRRFSAGYGDFPLKNQEIFVQRLALADLGVHLNTQYILEPEKTVTAIAGILKRTEQASE